MMGAKTLAQQCIWHPCAQMKDYETFRPLEIASAKGSYIQLTNGAKLLDAISSWWCKSLGHGHPQLKAALLTQMEKFEHVIFANTTHQTIVELSALLTSLLPSLDKVFYAGDGSCAVEVAMKMSLHYHQLAGKTKKTKFIALANGYHGETSAALSVSDLGIYRDPYQAMLFDPILIEPLYVTGMDDPAWQDAAWHWQQVEPLLEKCADTSTAIILEPIVQGAGGMHVYSQDFLTRLVNFAKAHDIHVIADEIMTGIGRTGKMLACEHAAVVPDFVCLSKGLTSGFLPFSAVLTTDNIYQMFYDDYETGKSFLHSHTYSGHALGASVALAALTVMQEEQLCERAAYLQTSMRTHMQDIAAATGRLTNIRGIGAVIAADLIGDDLPPRAGYAVYKKAVQLGALLRPLGNTIYWLPPLNIAHEDLLILKEITQQSISSL